MKTLGIIGGLGPQTTTKIYLSVIDIIRKSKKEKYPPIVIYNLPFPFIIENEAIIDGINSDKMLPYLIDGAKILEKSGANFAILPCNTLHKYIEEIRVSVKIPFLNIVEETLLKLKLLKIKSIGILATQTTINSNIYDSVFKKNSVSILYPTKTEQDNINKVIVQILNGKNEEYDYQKISDICDSLYKKGAECILLACTDLQIITQNVTSPIPIIDTTEILIQASVRELTNI